MVLLPTPYFKVIQSSLLEVKEASFCLLGQLSLELVIPSIIRLSQLLIAQQPSLQMATRLIHATIWTH